MSGLSQRGTGSQVPAQMRAAIWPAVHTATQHATNTAAATVRICLPVGVVLGGGFGHRSIPAPGEGRSSDRPVRCRSFSFASRRGVWQAPQRHALGVGWVQPSGQ